MNNKTHAGTYIRKCKKSYNGDKYIETVVIYSTTAKQGWC